jgi:hypothetical protein
MEKVFVTSMANGKGDGSLPSESDEFDGRNLRTGIFRSGRGRKTDQRRQNQIQRKNKRSQLIAVSVVIKPKGSAAQKRRSKPIWNLSTNLKLTGNETFFRLVSNFRGFKYLIP